MEKHFFVEERAIFISYSPADDRNQEYDFFSDLMDQHTAILKILETLKNKLQKREPFDLYELKKLLVAHKNFEEKSIYPVMDQKIDEDEKSSIIDRIKDIRI